MTKDIKNLVRLRKDNPDIPDSVKKKIDLRDRAFRGDAEAIIQMTIDCGMATRNEFEEIKQFTNMCDDVKTS